MDNTTTLLDMIFSLWLDVIKIISLDYMKKFYHEYDNNHRNQYKNHKNPLHSNNPQRHKKKKSRHCDGKHRYNKISTCCVNYDGNNDDDGGDNGDIKDCLLSILPSTNKFESRTKVIQYIINTINNACKDATT